LLSRCSARWWLEFSCTGAAINESESWLVAGIVPGIERPPLQSFAADALGADSEEKRELDTAIVDGLKVLDPDRPIREANIRS
jgi:hypothetical protein